MLLCFFLFVYFYVFLVFFRSFHSRRYVVHVNCQISLRLVVRLYLRDSFTYRPEGELLDSVTVVFVF